MKAARHSRPRWWLAVGGTAPIVVMTAAALAVVVTAACVTLLNFSCHSLPRWWQRAAGRADLIVVIVVAALASIVPAAGVSDPIARSIVGVPFVLFVPGYAAAALLFPGPSVRAVERVVLSLGVSLGIACMGGLVLQLSPWGLSVSSWVVLLALVTVGASLGALVCGSRRWNSSAGFGGLGLSLRQALLLALAGLIVAATIVGARLDATGAAGPGFTQLWILPPQGSQSSTLRLGVRNMEAGVASYQVVILLDAKLVTQSLLGELQPGQTWEGTITLPPGQLENSEVEARLYRLDDLAHAYRRVSIWLGE